MKKHRYKIILTLPMPRRATVSICMQSESTGHWLMFIKGWKTAFLYQEEEDLRTW